MIRTILTFCILLALSLATAAQTGTITNISVQPRADGSGMVDVHFNLSGSAHAYNINLEVSFDAGSNWQPIPMAHLSGNVTGISPGNNKHLVWDGFASFPNEYSTQTRLKIIAAAHTGGWIPGEGVTDIDGNFYSSVIICGQEWMAENLRVTRDANGNNIIRYWYNNDPTNNFLYGGLYTWHTVMNGATSSNMNPSNVQGICPTGWHIPSDAEWTELVNYVEAQGYPNESYNSNGAGIALKSCRQVSSPLGGDCATSEHPRWDSFSNYYGTDEFGFSALPGGGRNNHANFYDLGFLGNWWSSTEGSDAGAFYRQFNRGSHVRRAFGNKDYGFSVRCIKDSDQSTYCIILHLNIEGSGHVTGAGQYPEGTTINITASPNTGYTFVAWTGNTQYIADPNAASTTLTMPAQSISLTANFREEGGGVGVTDIDGNFYPSVFIGNQEWMAENLRVTRDANGNDITRYCYNNDAANCDLYGGLYTWHTVMNGATSSNNNPCNVQGICPDGWYLPSNAEWTELMNYLVAQGYPNSNVVNGAGNALKSCRQVSSPLGGDCATSEHPRWNSDGTHYGTDEFGFSALPGAHRNSDGSYFNIGNHGFWWNTTEFDNTRANIWRIYNYVGHLGPDNYPKDMGLSVRCIREFWQTTYCIILNLNPEGSGLVTGAGQYPEGATINITASPNTGYTFVNWTGDIQYIADPNAASTTLTMPAQNISVTANFEEDDWPIDYDTEVVDVINPATGKTWMDRNLGASRAATSSTDAEAYGDLYQWGRAADGHQKRSSGTITTLSNSDTPGHGDFILTSSSPLDWRSPQNDNLWQGVNGINNPCQAGYRLPTEAELNAELLSWSSYDDSGAFASPLKLPVAGFRSHISGALPADGYIGFYWSSTVSGTSSLLLDFDSEYAFVYSYARASGQSVRCIKD